MNVMYPTLVRSAIERKPLVRTVLERWSAASERLELSPQAAAVAALMLSAEFDDATHCAVCSSTTAPVHTRGDFLRSLGEFLEEPAAAAALTELEQRHIAVVNGATGSWYTQALYLAAEVRAYCLPEPEGGGAPKAAACAVRPISVPRLSATIESIRQLAGELTGRRLLVIIRGGPGCGRDTTLMELLTACGVSALIRSTADLPASVESLELELSGAAAVWDARRGEPTPAEQELAAHWLNRSRTLAIALLNRSQDPPEISGRRMLSLHVDPIDIEERQAIWAELLAGRVDPHTINAVALRLAQRSRSGRGIAARAIDMAGILEQDPHDAAARIELALDELIRPSTQRGIVVERPDVPFFRVIVADAIGSALEQLVVLAETAADLGHCRRRGVKALFAGPSGTGKTLAAQALASHLELPLYRIDLASVVSKWVGETEKNLSQALEAAEVAGAVLLFDEGDALFSKRGEVSRGTDRYANLEVSYLLQALESHDGIVIVTTNQKQSIDVAFQRRFDFSIEFTPPSAEARALLWQQELGPAGANLSRDQLEMLSGPELSGGNIAVAARLARALAHNRGGLCVALDDVHWAVAAELRKLGSTVKASHWSSSVTRRA